MIDTNNPLIQAIWTAMCLNFAFSFFAVLVPAEKKLTFLEMGFAASVISIPFGVWLNCVVAV